MKILWLYSDLLDLYGDRGNLMAVCGQLSRKGVSFEVEQRGIGEEIDFCEYSLIYIGPGMFSNLCVAMADFVRHGESVRAAIEKGCVFFVTGSSCSLFFESVLSPDKETVRGLGLLNFTGVETEKIIIRDSLVKRVGGGGELMYGFENSTMRFYNQGGERSDALFTRVHSKKAPVTGQEASCEGWHFNNFYATAMLGPVLVKNPPLLAEIFSLLVGEEGYLTPGDLAEEQLALDKTLSELRDF